jgi:hypothetical protein
VYLRFHSNGELPGGIVIPNCTNIRKALARDWHMMMMIRLLSRIHRTMIDINAKEVTVSSVATNLPF